VQGTLDLLILKVLADERLHGWGVLKRIEHMSQDVLRVNQGSLYPALYRLVRKKWIRSEWRVTENNRRARYYVLTARGAKQLASERDQWERLSGAVDLVLKTTG
jgi:transcriptional regulator